MRAVGALVLQGARVFDQDVPTLGVGVARARLAIGTRLASIALEPIPGQSPAW